MRTTFFSSVDDGGERDVVVAKSKHVDAWFTKEPAAVPDCCVESLKQREGREGIGCMHEHLNWDYPRVLNIIMAKTSHHG